MLDWAPELKVLPSDESISELVGAMPLAEQSSEPPSAQDLTDAEQQARNPSHGYPDEPSPSTALEDTGSATTARSGWRVRLPGLPSLVPTSRLLPTGFLPMPKIPYQSYAHFGWTHELKPNPTSPLGSSQGSPEGSLERQSMRLIAAKGVLSLWDAVQLRMHRMPAYRERISGLIADALGPEAGLQPPTPILPVQSFHLAPVPSFSASFRPPLLSPTQSFSQPVAVSLQSRPDVDRNEVTAKGENLAGPLIPQLLGESCAAAA